MTRPPRPHLLILLRDAALPTAAELRPALLDAGFAVHAVEPDPGGAGWHLRWLTDDGPRGAVLTLRDHPPDLEALPGPTAAGPEAIAAAPAHLLLVLDERPADVLEADDTLVRLGGALLPHTPAVGAHLGHLRTWHTAAAWGGQVAAAAGGTLPSSLLVDLSVGRVSPDAVGVLSHGLKRYDLDEVFVVGDLERMGEAWALARAVVHAALTFEDPPVDLHPGPHPAHPGETVEVGFLDE